MIAGANGIINLSVPLKNGRDQKAIMKDVCIDDREDWQKQHWKSLVSAYNRSPWFEHYRDELGRLYETQIKFLCDWDLVCFEWASEKLGLHPAVLATGAFKDQYEPAEYTDLRNRVLPKNYRDFTGVTYRQVFEDRLGFIPNLSILDLLFCEGKAARELLAR
jgi:WbqC-like protein family